MLQSLDVFLTTSSWASDVSHIYQTFHHDFVAVTEVAASCDCSVSITSLWFSDSLSSIGTNASEGGSTYLPPPLKFNILCAFCFTTFSTALSLKSRALSFACKAAFSAFWFSNFSASFRLFEACDLLYSQTAIPPLTVNIKVSPNNSDYSDQQLFLVSV